MNVQQTARVVLASAALVSGCGATDALDATNSMPGRMDRTNEKIASTNAKMDSMRDEVAKTNAEMKKTTSAVHKQVLETALTEMQKPENLAYLAPPTGILPAAQAFAEEATADEIIQLAYVYITDLAEVSLPQDLSKDDAAKAAPAFNQRKIEKLTILKAIVGLMPQGRVEELARTQIDEGGRYEDAAYSVLFLRADFINSVLLQADLLEGKTLNNLGKLEEAAKRAANVEWIVSRPYAKSVDLTFKVRWAGKDKPKITTELPADMMPTVWGRLSDALTAELDLPRVAAAPDGAQRLALVTKKIESSKQKWESK